MISVVMFGHAILPYVTIPRSFKDPENHVAFDGLAVFLYGFAMPVFFVTAGFSAALLLDRRGVRGLALSRFRTIFLPLIIVYPVLAPLTRGAYEFAGHAAASGSLQAGIDALRQGDWISWSRAYHLWFLVSLLLYTALAVALRKGLLRVAGRRTDSIRALSRHLFTSRWRALLLTLIVAMAMVPAYVFYGADATTLPMQCALFGFFLLGWFLYLHRDLLPTFRHGAWRPIAVAIVTLPLAAWATRDKLIAGDDAALITGIVAGIANSVLAAFMTFGLLGVFQIRFDRPSAVGQYLSDASYWIFLIHFPLLITVAGIVSVTPYSALVKYLLTVFLVVPIVMASYHYGVRSTPLGRLLKGRKRNPAPEPVVGQQSDAG